jgi:hypothetical protein
MSAFDTITNMFTEGLSQLFPNRSVYKGDMGWGAIILLGMFPVPVMGQLIARILYFKGTLDKSWLFLLSMPFLNLFVLMGIKLGIINLNEGSGPAVYDNNMYYPMINKFLSPQIVALIYSLVKRQNFMDVDMDNGYIKLFSYLLLFVSVYIVQSIRIYNACVEFKFDKDCNITNNKCTKETQNTEECDASKCGRFTGNMMGKTLIDSTIIMAISDLLETFIPIFMRFVPALVPILQRIRDIPTIGPYLGNLGSIAIWCLSYATGYILSNMFNQSDIPKYCNYKFLSDTFDNSLFAGSIVAIVLLWFSKSETGEEEEETEEQQE